MRALFLHLITLVLLGCGDDVDDSTAGDDAAGGAPGDADCGIGDAGAAVDGGACAPSDCRSPTLACPDRSACVNLGAGWECKVSCVWPDRTGCPAGEVCAREGHCRPGECSASEDCPLDQDGRVIYECDEAYRCVLL
jgi:hypothetical protein